MHPWVALRRSSGVRKRHVYVLVHEGLHCFKGHVGRLEVSGDVKGHFGECASVCVTEVNG